MSRDFLPGVPFVRGVNLPWLSYGNDFGRSAWHPNGGVAQSGPRLRLESVMTDLAAVPVDVIRWFVMCDGRAGLCESEEAPDGLDDAVFEDFSVAVTSAEDHGMKLLPVLLDFHWCMPRREHQGVRCGGRGPHLADSGRRGQLLRRVMRPFLSRFGSRKGIAAWDLINEPEWVTFSWQSWDTRHAVLPDAMCEYISQAALLVHECTEHPATLGLASAASLPHVRGLGVDLFSVHWYDRLDSLAPLGAPVASFGADADVLLGEFPSRGSQRRPAEIEAIAREAGYRGALAWSLLANDEASDAEAVWRWLRHE